MYDISKFFGFEGVSKEDKAGEPFLSSEAGVEVVSRSEDGLGKG